VLLWMIVAACSGPGRNAADTVAGRAVLTDTPSSAAAAASTRAGDVSPPVRPPTPQARGADPREPAKAPPTQQSATMDTARGIVAVVGSIPMTRVVVRPPRGPALAISGSLADEIGRASGAEVWVSGRRVDDRTLEVTRYAVRTVDGVAAVSGALAVEGDRLVLVTEGGRRLAIAHPPSPLRDQVGARVWISGDLGGTINAYGVLRPKR
jgi:hypothetical protein